MTEWCRGRRTSDRMWEVVWETATATPRSCLVVRRPLPGAACSRLRLSGTEVHLVRLMEGAISSRRPELLPHLMQLNQPGLVHSVVCAPQCDLALIPLLRPAPSTKQHHQFAPWPCLGPEPTSRPQTAASRVAARRTGLTAGLRTAQHDSRSGQGQNKVRTVLPYLPRRARMHTTVCALPCPVLCPLAAFVCSSVWRFPCIFVCLVCLVGLARAPLWTNPR